MSLSKSNKLLNSELDMLKYYKSNSNIMPPIINKKDLIMTEYENPLKNFMNESLKIFKRKFVSVRGIVNNEKTVSKTEKNYQFQTIYKFSKESSDNLKEKTIILESSLFEHDGLMTVTKTNKLNRNKSYLAEEEINRNLKNTMQFYYTTLDSRKETEKIVEEVRVPNNLCINNSLKKSHDTIMKKYFVKNLNKDKEHVRNPKINKLDIVFRNIKKNKEISEIKVDKSIEKKVYCESMNYMNMNNYNHKKGGKRVRNKSIVFFK